MTFLQFKLAIPNGENVVHVVYLFAVNVNRRSYLFDIILYLYVS